MEISAAILAGGRATRFGGADKASLLLGGLRIVDRQLAAIAAVSHDVRIVANDAARYTDLGVPVIADAIAGAGPLGGLYTALLDARHEWMLALACDLPFVTEGLLARLMDECQRSGNGDAVVPRSGRGLEPLCAVYRKTCAPLASARIERGELSLTGFLAELAIQEVAYDAVSPPDEDEGTLFENVNTPHDYARARGRLHSMRNRSKIVSRNNLS